MSKPIAKLPFMRRPLSPPARLVLAPVLLLVLGSTTRVLGQDAIRIDRLAEGRPGSGLAPGWNLRAVEDARLPATRLEVVDGTTALVMVADSAAGQAWLELDEPLDANAGTLEWEWSVAERIDGTELRDPELDDSPGRFFVVFGGGGLFGRPRLLFYTWGGAEQLDEVFLSHVGDRVGVVVVRNRDDAIGDWHTERRDAAADFRRVFDRDPDEVRAVGLMADTDQLGGRAEVRLRAVRWEEPSP